MSTFQLPYIDGFVVTVSKSNVERYRKIAAEAAVVWKDHGALDYKECLLDDARIENTLSFLDLAGAKKDETIIFAYIVYPSREARDEVNAKVMADPRIQSCCPENNPDGGMPFDCSRMAYGGFQSIVSI